MTPVAALNTAGPALFGARWRAPLARSLHRPGATAPGVVERLLHYWLSGSRPVPSWVPGELVRLLQAEADRRQESLGDLANRISASA